MRYLNFAAGLLLGVLLALGIGSQAVDLKPELDASFGQCKYKHSPEWVWWSPQFGFTGSMAPECLALGASWGTSNGFRIGLLDGGRFSTDNLALWGVDGQTYDPTQPCDVKRQRNCLAEFKGHGGMYGVTLGVWHNFNVGPFGVRPEIGALFYHSWFDVDATPQNPGTAQTMEWAHWDHASGDHYTPYAALPVRWKNVSLRLEMFRNVHELMGCGPSCFGGTNGPMRRISIVYHF